MNRQEFIGRLGRDIELRKTSEGVSVINFSLADTVKREGKEPETTWLDFEAWRSAAEVIAKFVKKGDMLYVAGETRNKRYMDKDGGIRINHVVVVKEFMLLPNARKTEEPVEPSYENEPWF